MVKRWVFQERNRNSKRELNETLEWKNTASEINSLDGPKRISFTIQEGSMNLMGDCISIFFFLPALVTY